MEIVTCLFEPCNRSLIYSRGYCRQHYNALAQGRPLRIMPERRHRSTPRRNRSVVLKRKGDRKHCIGCDRWLDEGDFPVDASAADGLASSCRPCLQAASHGLTLNELLRLLLDRGLGLRCAICGSDGPTVIDHDHRHCPGPKGCTRCVRGMLCGPCNAGIGLLGDDPRNALAAVEYLLRWDRNRRRARKAAPRALTPDP